MTSWAIVAEQQIGKSGVDGKTERFASLRERCVILLVLSELVSHEVIKNSVTQGNSFEVANKEVRSSEMMFTESRMKLKVNICLKLDIHLSLFQW